MSTHMPGFQSFFRFFASFCIGQIFESLALAKTKWGVKNMVRF